MKNQNFCWKYSKYKNLIWFCRTIMKSIGRFLRSRTSSLFRGLLPMRGSSCIVWKIGSDILTRREISTKCLSNKIFINVVFI